MDQPLPCVVYSSVNGLTSLKDGEVLVLMRSGVVVCGDLKLKPLAEVKGRQTLGLRAATQGWGDQGFELRAAWRRPLS